MSDPTCQGIDTSLCPDEPRDPMSCPPRCNEHAGYELTACALLGIELHSPEWGRDLMFDGKVYDCIDALKAVHAARCCTFRTDRGTP